MSAKEIEPGIVKMLIKGLRKLSEENHYLKLGHSKRWCGTTVWREYVKKAFMFDTCDTGKGQMNVDKNETYVLSNDK